MEDALRRMGAKLKRLLSQLRPAKPRQTNVLTRATDDYVELLQQRFEQAHREGDLAAALDLFDRLAEYRYLAMAQERGFDPSRPSVISSFAPKSGGTFIHNRMLEAGFKEYWWFFPNYKSHSWCIPSYQALPRYLAGGCTSHSHFLPEEHLIRALDAHGVDKIWVHLRNPAECVVSAYHHFHGRGHGKGEVAEQRRAQAAAEAKMLGMRLEESVSDFAAQYFDFFVDWAEAWLKYAAAQPGRVTFSYFSELADPQAMFQRVFNELGLGHSTGISRRPKSTDRFRKKIASDWRSNVESEVGDQIESAMGERLRHFSGYQRLCA